MQKILELTTSLTTTLAKEQALAGFVQGDIRYVAIEMGIAGLQPHRAQDVFTHRYGNGNGNGKDKAAVLDSATSFSHIY